MRAASLLALAVLATGCGDGYARMICQDVEGVHFACDNYGPPDNDAARAVVSATRRVVGEEDWKKVLDDPPFVVYKPYRSDYTRLGYWDIRTHLIVVYFMLGYGEMDQYTLAHELLHHIYWSRFDRDDHPDDLFGRDGLIEVIMVEAGCDV